MQEFSNFVRHSSSRVIFSLWKWPLFLFFTNSDNGRVESGNPGCYPCNFKLPNCWNVFLGHNFCLQAKLVSKVWLHSLPLKSGVANFSSDSVAPASLFAVTLMMYQVDGCNSTLNVSCEETWEPWKPTAQGSQEFVQKPVIFCQKCQKDCFGMENWLESLWIKLFVGPGPLAKIPRHKTEKNCLPWLDWYDCQR